MILYAKFGEHQPLNRQSQSFAREGIELDVSTLADWVGACTASLAPLNELIRRHVLAAERLHGDDTTNTVMTAVLARFSHHAAIVEAMRAKTERQPAAMRIQFYQEGMQRLLKLASCRALTMADVWSQAEN
jgi:hypothetical protein